MQIWVPVDQGMGWGQGFFLWKTQFTPMFIDNVSPPCFRNSGQGDPPQILSTLQWGNMVRRLVIESDGFQNACEEYGFLMAISAS